MKDLIKHSSSEMSNQGIHCPDPLSKPCRVLRPLSAVFKGDYCIVLQEWW